MMLFAIDLSPELIDAVHALPSRREVEHCSATFTVSPFDIYAVCPRCGTRLKVRSFSAVPEIEDVFDAVFEWMNTPAGREAAERRLREIAADGDE
jgi:hypothetical protein